MDREEKFGKKTLKLSGKEFSSNHNMEQIRKSKELILIKSPIGAITVLDCGGLTGGGGVIVKLIWWCGEE